MVVRSHAIVSVSLTLYLHKRMVGEVGWVGHTYYGLAKAHLNSRFVVHFSVKLYPTAQEKALNCTEWQSTAEHMTVPSDYFKTQPGYYFVVAANSPFLLQYTVDLWGEALNLSDYTELNCSIVGGEWYCFALLLYYYTSRIMPLSLLSHWTRGLYYFASSNTASFPQ